TRSERSMGRPAESVTLSKQQKIIKTTEYYIVCHPALVEREGLQPRFDCIEVFASSEGRPVAYEYIKNAFTAN
ncbi:MAG: YraN family protein, partial [Clostridia bacterium]|nr:YraN family protein [Clostridia bacterium]